MLDSPATLRKKRDEVTLTDFQRRYLFQICKSGKPRIETYGIYHHSDDQQSKCITKAIQIHNALTDARFDPPLIRHLTLSEVERLQGFPPHWVEVDRVSKRQAYGCLGNAVTVPVIVFILKQLREIL
jgi:site-specific DNA-cytosine methylase